MSSGRSSPAHPNLDTALEERELHEDFKRLARLSAARPLPTPVDATIVSGERTSGAVCVEVSNEALGLLVPPRARPISGEPLTLRRLGHRDSAALMRDVECRVENVGSVEGTEMLFVTASILPRPAVPAAPLRITNPLRVRAVIEGAIASGVRVDRPGSFDHDSSHQTFSTARLEGDQLHLQGTSIGWQQGQVLRLWFDVVSPGSVEHRQLLGHATVLRVSSEALVMSVPGALVERTARLNLQSVRLRDQVSISFVSPLSGRGRMRRVLELSATGLTFKVDPADVLPQGLVLGEVTLQVGARILQLPAVVHSLGQLEFRGLTAEVRQQLLEVLLQHRVDGARCGAALPFKSIWALFQEEGEQWRDHSEAPMRAQQALGDGSHGLGKTVALVRDGELVAHASGLRIYSHTWLSQHLLVKSGFHRAGSLSQQVLSLSFEVGEALPDVEYVRGLWRASHSNAERIFEGVSTRLLRPGLAYRLRIEPMRLRLERALPPGSLRVREAGPDDERDFLQFVAASVDPVKVLSDDLVPGELQLESLSRRYAALGLARSRALTVVEDEHGSPLGWALHETMSTGLFWAEMYSSFRIFLRAPSGPLANAARVSLAAHAAGRAREQGRTEAECHASAQDVAELEALGFVRLGTVYEFGAHRAVMREFTDQMGAVLARCRRRERSEGRQLEQPAEQPAAPPAE